MIAIGKSYLKCAAVAYGWRAADVKGDFSAEGFGGMGAGLCYDGCVDVGGLGVLGFGGVDALSDGYGDGGFGEYGG